MKNALKILLCSAAFLATVPVASSAMAGNRALPALSAVYETPDQTNCFSHAAGFPLLKNTCADPQNVFLPISVDAAGSYSVSAYGRGVLNRSGRRTITCTANGLHHDGTMVGVMLQGLPNTPAFGGAQVLNIVQIPVFSPGDSLYAYCQLQQDTELFTYGWNY
jgi:hypothetical protein